MRILHFADVHLDRPFSGHDGERRNRRRADLRAVLGRCLDLAREKGVDLVTVGGDLWEDEHVTADTRRSVADQFAAFGQRVLLIAGNHDRILPGGAYERTSWPDNVRVFAPGELTHEEADNTAVWGISWGGGNLEAEFLRGFTVPDDGRAHVLLLHGTADGGALRAAGNTVHCPFESATVIQAGFSCCLAGHIHAASARNGVIYPGSPEPLGWAETGRHCVALVDIEPREPVRVELMDVNATRYETIEVDAAGVTSSSALREVVGRALPPAEPNALHLRLKLEGDVASDCLVDPWDLTGLFGERYAGLRVDNATQPAYDLDALSAEGGLRGRFVGVMRDRLQSAAKGDRLKLELALIAGLRALDGRSEVLDVD